MWPKKIFTCRCHAHSKGRQVSGRTDFDGRNRQGKSHCGCAGHDRFSWRQALLDPAEHVTVGFHVDQPPGPRDRRMFRCPILQPKAQEAPHRQRVRCTPCHPTLGVQALEVPHQPRGESSVQGAGSDAPEQPHRTGGTATPRICRSPRTPAPYSNANRKDAPGSVADRSSVPTTPLDVSHVCPSPCTNTKTYTCHVRPAQRALSPRTASAHMHAVCVIPVLGGLSGCGKVLTRFGVQDWPQYPSLPQGKRWHPEPCRKSPLR